MKTLPEYWGRKGSVLAAILSTGVDLCSTAGDLLRWVRSGATGVAVVAFASLGGCVTDESAVGHDQAFSGEESQALQVISDHYAHMGMSAWFDELKRTSVVKTMMCDSGYAVYFVPKSNRSDRPEFVLSVARSDLKVNSPKFRHENCYFIADRGRNILF